MAYYHTYASQKLKLLKASLNATLQPMDITSAEIPTSPAVQLGTDTTTQSIAAFERILMPESEAEYRNLCRAAKMASAALFLRAKLGFKYVARTAPLDMGFHYVFAGFEGALLLSCWAFAASHQERVDAETCALQSTLRDIVEEMDDQLSLKERPAIAPLAGIRSMMECGWIWAFPHSRAKQLLLQESKIATVLDRC